MKSMIKKKNEFIKTFKTLTTVDTYQVTYQETGRPLSQFHAAGVTSISFSICTTNSAVLCLGSHHMHCFATHFLPSLHHG